MIENFRKYTGLMIVVLVLLFVGLVFLGDGVTNSLGSKPVMEVGGKAISKKEFDRHMAMLQLPAALPSHVLPRDTRVLASHYVGEGIITDDRMYSRAGSIVGMMTASLQPSRVTPEKFIANRLNVQKAGLEFGVTPSNEEVESFVENVLFADVEGKPDQEAYSEFIKNRATDFGGTRGFNDFIRDLLTAQNLAKVLGGGYSPEAESIKSLYDDEKQLVTAQQISLESAPYEGKINPTEEELKAYYEENKGNYNSDELRKVSYILIEPNWEKTLKEVNDAKAKVAKQAKEAEEARKKAAEEARKANEANKPKPEETPKPEEKPDPATTDETPAPDAGDSDPAPETGSTPETGNTPESTEEGSQGDPGEPGEPAPTPPVGEAPASAEEKPETTDAPKPPVAGTESTPVETTAAEVKPGETTTPPLEVKPTDPKPAETKPAPPKTAKEQLNGAEKEKAVKALIPDANKFFQLLTSNYGEDFEKLAKDNGYTVVQSDFFSKTDPPKELSGRILSSRLGTIADALFLLPPSGDSDEKISDPHQTSDGWFIGRLDEVQESIPLIFEEARVKVSIDLKKKLAREKMMAEAKELHEKISTALKAGKSFEEAAKENGKEVKKLDDLAAGMVFNLGPGQTHKMPDPPAFLAAQHTNPGELAPLSFTPSEEEASEALVIFVEKREVLKDDEYRNGLNTRYETLTENARQIAFENWLNDRFNESDVVPPKLSQ